MQPLLLMKQTLEATYDPGTFLLDGPNVRFTSAKQVLSTGKKNFSVGFGIGKDLRATFNYLLPKTNGLQIANLTTSSNSSMAAVIRMGMSYEELRTVTGKWPDRWPLLATAEMKRSFRVSSDRCLLDLGIYDFPPDFVGFPNDPGRSQIAIRSFLLNMLHLPGLRGNPERTYKTTSTSNPFPGSFEIYFASVIHQWKIASEAAKLAELGATMAALGLTSAVTSERVDDTKIELKVARTTTPKATRGKSDFVSIADVGLGVSHVLPVIVALQVAVQDQIVYLEQPEIHLHPRAQVALASVIARAVNRGVIVIAETHSSLLLRGIQTLVAEGELSGKDVALHWFQRNPKTGKTKISHTELDQDGAFGDWPADFDDIQLGSSRQYLDAVAKRHLG